jgi:aspartate-semialdehyde dehydrogenase
MDASVATEIERAFADAGHLVVSNSKNHRMEPDVPLLVPEINSDHLALIRIQRERRGWKGGIATNPNCSTVALTMGLAPLANSASRRDRRRRCRRSPARAIRACPRWTSWPT